MRATVRPVTVAIVGVCLPLLSTACGDGRPGERTLSSRAGADSPWSDALRQEVLGMRDADQEVRGELMELMPSGADADSAAFRSVAARQDSVDEANTARLEEIIRRHGWPGVERAGREAASAAFLIVQHATHDPAFQKEYLAFLEREHRAGRVPGEAVALLTDRVRQAEGRRQLYGTQMTVRDGEVVIDPIHDEENVDRRREALGLPPLAAYVEQVREAYGLPD